MTTTRIATVLGGLAVAAFALAGCSSDDGASDTVGPTITASTTTTSATTSAAPSSEPPATSSEAPSAAGVPGDAFSMTCGEFLTLDEAAQTAVAGQIVESGRTNINPNNVGLAAVLAKSMCTHQPSSTVAEALGATGS